MFSRIRSCFRHEQANANKMFTVCPHCHQWGEFGRCGFCGFDAGDPQAVTRLRAVRASGRVRQRAFWQQTYDLFDGMFHFHAADFIDFLRNAVKWTVLGGAVGVLAGTASWIFLVALAWATATRLANPSLILLLPLGGFGMGWLYHRFGGTAALGNNLVIDEVNNNRSKIPLRMAPLVLLGTIVTHLFGGSAGREGSAIQMGASLTDIMVVLHGHADHTGLILTQTAADIMTHPALTVTTESRAFDAVRLLIDNQIKRMPVIDHNGKVAGLVSRRALLHGMVR